MIKNMIRTITFYLLALFVVVLLTLGKAHIFQFLDFSAFLWVFLGPLFFTCISYHPKGIYNAVVALVEEKDLQNKEKYLAGAQLFKRLEENTVNLTLLGVFFAFISLLIHYVDPHFIGPSMGFGFLVSLYGITLSKLLFLPCMIKLEMDANPRNIPKIRLFDWRIFVLLPFLFLFFLNLFPEVW
jgi:flagellar motor component MotA